MSLSLLPLDLTVTNGDGLALTLYMRPKVSISPQKEDGSVTNNLNENLLVSSSSCAFPCERVFSSERSD